MVRWATVLILFLNLSSCTIKKTEISPLALTDSASSVRLVRMMFYNCENLFDCDNDSLTNDDDYTPAGKNGWTPDKYWKKLRNISKVIMAVGEWQAPELVGLCEVENRKILMQLIYSTPLSRANYRILHSESHDLRGIDVALLYNPDIFELLDSAFIPIFFASRPSHKTRDILYAKGKLISGDTLHVFVNHWPSRRGGEEESEESRMVAAQTLRQQVDSIFLLNPLANIIITGDFNDEPENISITETLSTRHDYEKAAGSRLYNLSYYLKTEKNQGSIKHGMEWNLLDQIIVSGNLLLPKSRIFTRPDLATVFSPSFLLAPDAENMGTVTFRTYSGPRYLGGFSDHLPVYVDLMMKKE